MVKSWGELKDQHQIKNGENERNLVQKKRFKFLIMFLFGACESYFSNPIYENITLILLGLYPENHIHWKHLQMLQVTRIFFILSWIYNLCKGASKYIEMILLQIFALYPFYIIQKYKRIQANLVLMLALHLYATNFLFQPSYHPL